MDINILLDLTIRFLYYIIGTEYLGVRTKGPRPEIGRNDMARYNLDMAGIQWEISSPVKFDPDEKMSPFLVKGEKTDIRLSFQIGNPEIPGNVVWERFPKVRKEGSRYWVERTLAVRTKPSGCICLDPDDLTKVEGWIYPDHVDDIKSLESMMDISELEILLTQFDTFSLHSSFIRWKGHGILFTAPSGTGKSTQADLWEATRNAQQLNGDRSMVRWEKGTWTAYGSPFAGSSGIYKNESAPIGAIVVLRQAGENTLTVLNPSEAFRLLYSETVIPKWYQDAHEKIIHLVMKLASEIPVVMLQCLPDESAVEVLEQYLNTLDSFQNGRAMNGR